MKSRRHPFIAVIAMASVFLCLLASCGIPTYLTEVSATITASNDSTFALYYDSESVSADSDKVGLLLLYYIGDSTNSAKSSVNTQFKNKFRPTQYDGSTVNAEANTPVLTYNSSNNTTYEFYAFETGSGVVEAPLYTYQIQDNPAYLSVELTYDETHKTIDMVVKNSLLVVIAEQTLILHDDFQPSLDNNYIHIYGAVSVQGKNYSNIYWSDLQYCGSLLCFGQ